MKTSAERWNGFRYSQKRRGKEPLGLNGGWDGSEERSYHVVWRGFLTHYRKIKITSEKISSTAFKTCQSHSYLSSWHVFMCVCGSSAQRWFPRVRSYFKVIYEEHFSADLPCYPHGFVVINKHVYLYDKSKNVQCVSSHLDLCCQACLRCLCWSRFPLPVR